MTAEQRHETALDLLVFELDDVRFGLELTSVREVVRAVFITPLPEAPPVIEGIIDVRGSMVPVYDLRARFGLAARSLHPAEHMVIAWTGQRLVAVRCDRAEWIERIAESAVERGDPVTRGGERIAGVARAGDDLVLIHDLSTFLEEAERARLDDALAAHEERDAD
jgi:purine-binding chemotaxis protein CheW